jgi:hypothetical protein
VAAAEKDPRKVEVAQAFIRWLHEWREIARIAIARRDYRISLGLAQRRRVGAADGEADDVSDAPADARATSQRFSSPCLAASAWITLGADSSAWSTAILRPIRSPLLSMIRSSGNAAEVALAARESIHELGEHLSLGQEHVELALAHGGILLVERLRARLGGDLSDWLGVVRSSPSPSPSPILGRNLGAAGPIRGR